MSSDQPLPFIYQFAAGAVAGVSEILVMYPLDVVKTRVQLQTGKGTGADSYNGMIDCFQKIVRNEGFSRLYRGINAPILMEAPKRATKFAANDAWGKFYRESFGVTRMNQSLSVLTGATAGVTESFVVVPFELIKIRLQDKASAGKYSGMVDAVVKTVKAEALWLCTMGWRAPCGGTPCGMLDISAVSSKFESSSQRLTISRRRWGTICCQEQWGARLVQSSTPPWMSSSLESKIAQRLLDLCPSTTGRGQPLERS